MATMRSVLRYVSEGFIPEGPLPRVPHKNSSLREALEAAWAFGCRLKPVNDNDVAVSHQLITVANHGRRPGLAVSSGRRDTSQALVSFLRKVEKAIMEHREKHPALATAKTNGHHPTPIQRPAMRPTVAAPFPELVPVPEPAAAAPELPYRPAPRFPNADEAKFFGQIMAQLHYRHHATDSEFVGFSECTDSLCVSARKHLSSISQLSAKAQGNSSEMKQLLDEHESLLKQHERLKAELEAVNKERDELKAQMTPPPMRMLTPDPGNDEASTRLRSAQAAFMHPAAEKLFAGFPWPQEDTDGPERARRLTFFYTALRQEIEPHIPGMVYGRIMDALEQALRTSGYSQDWVAAFRTLNFDRFKSKIMQQRRPGGSRAMVGNYAWMDFQVGLDKLKKDLLKDQKP